jgi:hypothetical protein
MQAETNDQQTAKTSEETKTMPETQTKDPVTAKSGKGAFEVTFPDGWGSITNVKDGDFMVIPGMAQALPDGGRTTFINGDSYGSDSPVLLSIALDDTKDFAPAEGTAADYTLVNNKTDSIKGKKYSKEYDKDTEEGIGYLRLKGDRTYEYRFELSGNRTLAITYSVYGSDPHNHVEAVNSIVDSIRILN